jgi:hypothetical protein
MHLPHISVLHVWHYRGFSLPITDDHQHSNRVFKPQNFSKTPQYQKLQTLQLFKIKIPLWLKGKSFINSEVLNLT